MVRMEEDVMQKIYLIGRAGVHANESFLVEDEIIIGRNPKLCQIVYPSAEKKISGAHCKLQQINGKICLIDLDSTNGTFFEDGTKLEPNMPRPIENGHGFYLGGRENSFDIRVEDVQEKNLKKKNVNNTQKLESAKPVQNSAPTVIYQGKKSGSAGTVVAIILLFILLLVGASFAYSYYQESQKSGLEKMIEDGGDVIDDIRDSWSF